MPVTAGPAVLLPPRTTGTIAAMSSRPTHAWRVQLSLSLLAALAVSACGESLSLSDGLTPPGLRALSVVGCDQGLRVEFTSDVDAATVTSQTFLVERSTGTVSYDPAGRTASYVPLDPFVTGDTYTAVLTQEIATTQGAHLPEPLRWQFTCVDRSAPVLIERSPLGESQSPLVRPMLRFNEPLDEATLTAENVRIVGVESNLVWDASSRTLTLVPLRALYPGRGYTVKLGAKVRDLSGNALGTDVTWTFRTRESTDDWAARVLSPAVPAATACDAAIELRVATHVEIEPSAFASAPVVVDGAPDSTATWDESRRVIRVLPSTPLRPGESYPLRATSALRDRHGDRLFDDFALLETLTVVDDCARPTVASVPAAWGFVGCDEPIFVQFSSPMDLVTVEEAVQLRDLAAGGWVVDASPLVATEVMAGESEGSIALLPVEPLQHGRRYWLTVTTAAMSTQGVALSQTGGWEVLATCE